MERAEPQEMPGLRRLTDKQNVDTSVAESMKVFLEQAPRYTTVFRSFLAFVQRLPNYPNVDTVLEDMNDFFEQVEPQEMPVLRRLTDKRNVRTSVAEDMKPFDEQASPQDWSVFRRFVADNRRVTNTHDLIPIDEVEKRLELAAKITKQTATVLGSPGQVHPTRLTLTFLLMMPMGKLENLADSRTDMVPYLSDYIMDMVAIDRQGAEMIRHFLTNPSPEQRLEEGERMSESSASAAKRPRSNKRSSISSIMDKPRNRDAKEAAMCLERDQHSCILLRTKDPHACHIIPFSVNSTTQSSATTLHLANMYHFFTDNVHQVLDLKQRVGSLGASDKRWNMLALNCQLHNWWSRAYWAFKCLGIEPVDGKWVTTLQFRWMPKVSANPLQRVNIEAGEGRAMVQSLQTTYGMTEEPELTEIVNAAYAISNRPLLSGHTVAVRHDTLQEAESMQIMIDLQWACVVLAAISGATGPSNLPEYDDDDDDGDLVISRTQSIPQWLEQLSDDR